MPTFYFILVVFNNKYVLFNFCFDFVAVLWFLVENNDIYLFLKYFEVRIVVITIFCLS